MLAGGPSPVPEKPITAVNVGLAFRLGRWLVPRAPGGLWAEAAAATIGALFGTPVAAALLLSEALAGRRLKGALWDNVFAPLVAAAGVLTTTLVAHPSFDRCLPAFGRPGWGDPPAAPAVASVAALLGMCAVRALPYVHGVFARPGHPMVAVPVSGLVLGLLAALGGHLTLFKGLDEVGEIAAGPDGWAAREFATMTVVKPAALLVAASCGFRGGRIFPAVFADAALGPRAHALGPRAHALGPCAHALVPGVHRAVGVACGVLGMLLAITRQGWVSRCTAAVLMSSPAINAPLCMASLPTWLLVTVRPPMQLRGDGTPVR